ncbi:hypothetical protein J5N97_022070 [Dioscorea zingiberensis]|uniref:Nucleotide-diphospho-sugar transferase domain-containing protein n=1 Tax=Dioscorea zingiberensis TaxID=325984 RepID=A0A9D5C9P5_9LILI|nr:hypothetical protein J5N97_022070 [Dioscorea zingiberensis]
MLELFMESLRIGEATEHLLRHVVVVAMDLRAFERCKSVNAGQYCFLLQTRGVDFSADKKFMTGDFLKMMWNRIDFLRLVLDLGYSFIFTDVDVMWLRNPISKFPGDGHMTISCDRYNGNPWDKKNRANTGFLYVKSNAFTIEFYKYWYMARVLYPGLNDQHVFYKIKNNPFVQELGIQINYLDTAYFGGFCQPSEDVRKVCTMHANCCVGVENKLNDLRVLVEDWRMYRNGSVEVGGFKWRVPRKCHL